MFVYPYKQIKAGKFTKYLISMTSDGMILVEHQFKGRRKRQELFKTAKSIKEADFPKNVKEAALWAKQDASGLGLGG